MPAEPQVRTVNSEFVTGKVALGADLGSRYSDNEAIFRHVEVRVPEPSTFALLATGLLALICMMRRMVQ